MTPIQDITKVIFLDIDGVFLRKKYSRFGLDHIQKQVAKEFNHLCPRNIRQIANTHYFSQAALVNLDLIIEKAGSIGLGIVISSAWRERNTTENLRKFVFAKHSFSKKIIDRTIYTKRPFGPWYKFEKNADAEESARLQLLKKAALNNLQMKRAKKGIETRADEIQHWLNKHPNIKKFVILDDNDDSLSLLFPYHFVRISNLLSESNAKRAIKILTSPEFTLQQDEIESLSDFFDPSPNEIG